MKRWEWRVLSLPHSALSVVVLPHPPYSHSSGPPTTSSRHFASNTPAVIIQVRLVATCLPISVFREPPTPLMPQASGRLALPLDPIKAGVEKW
ncbi:hypothetical protein GGX14DRAFT_569460 [Mycena pura]|uniref:Secreted protein n=1 Tax=Mycena pura TaxID=153505 RepID=A0AAD6V955_9AGAR|nr:hypothetical protein GGX14DRAFT_569460 [Mycena pura]